MNSSVRDRLWTIYQIRVNETKDCNKLVEKIRYFFLFFSVTISNKIHRKRDQFQIT